MHRIHTLVILAAAALAACSTTHERAESVAAPTSSAPSRAQASVWPANTTDYRTTDGATYLGNLDARIDGLRRRHAADPDSGAALPLAGALYHRFRIRGALADFDAAQSLIEQQRARADSVELRVLSATFNNAMHAFGNAQADLARARALGARDEQLHTLERDLNLALGNYTALHTDYALARQPTAEFHEQAFKAFLLNQQGDLPAATAAYALAQGLYHDVNPVPLSWLHVQQGIAFLDRGRIEDAERFFRTAAERLPGYTLAEEHWAETLFLLGRHDQARQIYRRVIEATGNPEYMAALADLEQAAGDSAAANTWRERAVQTYGQWLDRYPLAYAEHAAEFFLEQGDHQRARVLAEANAANRSDVASLVLLARVEHQMGNLEGACRNVARAARSGLRTADLEEARAQITCGDVPAGASLDSGAATGP